MAKSPIDPISALALSGGEAPGLQAQLLELLVSKLAEEKAEKDAEKSQKLAARKAGAKAMQDRREMELSRQASCSHKKPNNMPAIAGQRDHQNKYHYICAYCAKTWVGDRLPPDLRIPAEMVGGPNG